MWIVYVNKLKSQLKLNQKKVLKKNKVKKDDNTKENKNLMMSKVELDLKIKEIGETDIYPYDRPEDSEIQGNFFESVYRYHDLIVEKVDGNYDLIHCIWKHGIDSVRKYPPELCQQWLCIHIFHLQQLLFKQNQTRTHY